MPDYVIYTDSASDLGADMAEELGVEVVPLTFSFGDRTYRNLPDGRDMSTREFYDRIRSGQQAVTSGVNPGAWLDAMLPAAQAGKDILVLAFSSALSATLSSAETAAEELRSTYPERKILVVDTLCASLGQGLLVYRAAKKKEAGASIEEVRDFVLENIQETAHYFTVDDLKYLRRGGRISAATAAAGSMLQIKPILEMDPGGHLISIGRARGRKASLEALLDRMEKHWSSSQDPVFISHADCPEDAQRVADGVRDRFGVSSFYINYIGPVIGAHTGPGTVALFFQGTRE